MTSSTFQRETVFAGQDIYGVRLAKAWMPMKPQALGAADLTVQFKAQGQGPTRFATLQAAIDKAIKDSAEEPIKQRRLIEIGPGFFEGPVVVPPDAPPITLRGAGVGHTVLAAGIDAQMPGLEYRERFASGIAAAGAVAQAHFAKITARQTIGTQNSAVLSIARDDVVVSGMTIRNDYQCDRVAAASVGAVPDATGRFATGQHQAVALQIKGADRVQIQHCSLSSFQDTLFLQSDPKQVSRVSFDRCFIEGDVDFIFGGATAHFMNCEVRSRGERGAYGWATAPSTSLHLPYGFVFDCCTFTHDGAETGRDGRTYLGRQWFEGVRATPYGVPSLANYSCKLSDVNRFGPPHGSISRATLEAVGKCAVVDSKLDDHIDPDRPWDAWAGPDWSPRYRPVQACLDDFLNHLAVWLRANALDYSKSKDSPAWLIHL